MAEALKYSDFAKAIQVARGSVTMAVKSGTLIPVVGEKKIDPTNPTNRAWIDKQEAKGKVFDIRLIYSGGTEIEKQKSDAIEKKENNLSENTAKTITIEDIRKIELKQKLAVLKKTMISNKGEELKLKKIEGTLIPVDAVKTVFLFSVEIFRTIYTQNIDNQLNIITTRLEVDNSIYRELQKDIREDINSTLETVREKLIEGVENIIKEYKEVRGRGERK